MAVGIIGTLLIAAFLSVIIAIIMHYVKKMRLYLKASRFPGPPTIPFIGNALTFLGSTAEIHVVISKIICTYPSPSVIWLGSRALFVVCEPEQLKVVLNSPKSMGKDELYKLARPWVGDGLLTAPVSIWRHHRKLITPTFHPKILQSFFEIFSRQSEVLATRLKKEANGNEFDVFPYVSSCTLDIICETAMGIKIEAQLQPDHPFVHSIKRVFEVLVKRAFKVWLHPDFIFRLTQGGKDHNECIKHLHSISDEVLKKKMNSQNNANASKDETTVSEKTPNRKIFLDLLMELSDNGTKFTKKELQDEVNTMIVAGNDTTATVNTFVLFMLANYPHIQEEAYRELCEIFGDEVSSYRPLTTEDISRMKYLERVIKETLRLFPVAPFIVRAITDDLDIGGCTLPKESSVVIAILELHRCEKYWTDPLKFDPDRFLPEEVAKRDPYSYIPFSSGPRNCLGMKYAMLAMKALVSTVLRRFVLKLDKTLNIDDIKLKGEVVLQTVEPIRIKIEERSRYICEP